MAIKNYLDIKSILFNNQTIKQTIFKNTFWLTVAEIVTRFLTFLLFTFVARILGPTEYGKFSFALSFVYLSSIFADLGISQIITREFSKEKEKEKDYPALLSLKIVFISITLILVLVASILFIRDLTIQKIVWILAFYIFIGSFSQVIYAFFQARQKIEYQAWANILQATLFFILGFLFILIYPSAQGLSFGFLVATLIFLTFILMFFHLKIFPLRLSFNFSAWRSYLGLSWPLALNTFFVTIYNQTDSVMLGYSGQITQTGFYNAAYRIALFCQFPIALISSSFFPVLSKSFKESRETFQNIWHYQFRIMVLLSVPIVTGGIFLASKIIDFLYNPDFFPSILAFKVLILTTGIIFIINPFSQILIVSDKQKNLFFATFFGAVLNVFLNLILIPRYSLYGAAVATLFTNILILFLLLQFALRFTQIKFINSKTLLTFLVACISSLIMYLIISLPQIYSLHVIFPIIIGAVVYFLFLFIFHIFKII